MVEQRKQARGWRQQFIGYRVNCESVPCLPAWAITDVLADPRRVPYLLVWVGRDSGEVRESVRVAAYSEPPRPIPLDWTGWVEVKRSDRAHSLVRTIERPLPRNGGKARFMVCPYCHRPRRALYGWEVDRFSWRAREAPWQCRSCAGLSYASEGGGLRLRLPPRILGPERYLFAGNAPRPEPWLPHVFASPEDAAAAGLCTLKWGVQ